MGEPTHHWEEPHGMDDPEWKEKMKIQVTVKLKMEEFGRHELVPDVLHEHPEQILTIKYEQEWVNLGHTLTPSRVANPPTILDWEASPRDLFCLMMIDPDAPSRSDPKFRSVLHWLIVNIPGNKWDHGETLAPYVGSGPEKGTGFHRYLFLVYRQRAKIAEMDIGYLDTSSARGRRSFSLSKFVRKHDLTHAIAGNFFQAKWDDAVVAPEEKAIYEKNRTSSHGRVRTMSIDHGGDED